LIQAENPHLHPNIEQLLKHEVLSEKSTMRQPYSVECRQAVDRFC